MNIRSHAQQSNHNVLPIRLTVGKRNVQKQGSLRFNLVLLFIAVLALFFIIVIKSKTASIYADDPLIFSYAIFVTFFQLSRVVAAFMYERSREAIASVPSGMSYEPTVSFVVPCKNEEASIAKTIQKCFETDYPLEKIEVIVINDGSTDNTGKILDECREVYGDRLTIVHWEINQGKRHGMAEGFRRATGEIVVQLDSDSYIVPETFRGLIEPFANPEIGAVCAHADPENADQNILTRMQAAYYFVSFRILKAAESAFATVFCCSGCSSAYRRSVVMPVLDEWLGEKFLGRTVTWGDDRALTNRVILAGYRTIYTDVAKAYTIVPHTFKMFLKQQTRWKKGWFVNSMFASRFIIRREPFVACTYFLPLILVTLITPFMATRALVFNPLVRGISPFFYILGIVLVSVLMVLFYRYVAHQNKYWPYVFLWSGINMIFLSFILFYSLITIQNRKWGTR